MMTSDTSCRTALKTETDNFVIDLHTDPLSLKHACRDSGWCTKYIFSATSYCLMGPLWTIRKRGKNRPSYLFWKNQCTELVTFAYDFRHRQNDYVEPLEFIAEHPELRHWFATAISTDYKPAFDRECLRQVMLEEGMQEVNLGDTADRRRLAHERLKQMITGFVDHANPFPEPHQAMGVFQEIAQRRHKHLHAAVRPCVPDVRGVDHPDFHANVRLGHYPHLEPTREHARLVAQENMQRYLQSQDRERLTGRQRYRTRLGQPPEEMRTGRADAGDAVDRFMADFGGRPSQHAEMRLFNDIVDDMVGAAEPVEPPMHPSVPAGHQNLHALMEQSLRGVADIERNDDGDITYYNAPFDAEDMRQIVDRYGHPEDNRIRDSPELWSDTERLFFRLAVAWSWLAITQVSIVIYSVLTGLGYGR